MLKVFVIVTILVAFVNGDCLSCICARESSGCTPKSCGFDVNGDACGYFQIHYDYYTDCGTPGRRNGESITDAWKRCSMDYDCSATCVKNYVKKYAHDCTGVGACEQMSRLHNGGPQGCHKDATLTYWNGIKKCCGCK